MKKNNSSFLAFSFSPGFNSPNLPIATFHQGDIDLNFIIDTGSDQNVIDSTILQQLRHTKTDDKSNLTGLGGTQIVEHCIIPFSHEEDNYTAEFLVSDLKEAFGAIKKATAVPIHGMLGSKFLMKNNFVLDFNTLNAYNTK